MTAPQFVDVSQWNPASIDWQAYKALSASVDGVSRVAMRSSYGNGYTDANFAEYRAGALAAGIDCIFYYHFAYPQYNTATDEANWQKQVVGAIRSQDLLVLDFEENVDAATSAWALAWLQVQNGNYGKLPGIYSSSAYIAQRLQDIGLAIFPLWLANWQYDPNERPPVPSPWSNYEFVQYTDKATNIPGISGVIDADIFLGGNTMVIPSGWTDDGTTLTAPNKIPVVLGFRDHVLNNNWDKDNWPLEIEQHLATIEYSNDGLGAGQAQTFRKTRLEYTPKTGIFEGWLGQELLWYQQQFIAQQAQLTALQGENAQLQALLAASNLGQISTLGQQIADDVALIQKLSQVQ